jgi:hypothetical protein
MPGIFPGVLLAAACAGGVWPSRGPGGALAGRTDVRVLWLATACSKPALRSRLIVSAGSAVIRAMMRFMVLVAW